jgi:phenylpropionate dioxygenase-like ring-hydroxylating dioxygenase large terminal subunit
MSAHIPAFPARFWYVAALASEVGEGFLARTLLSRPVLLYRGENGEPIALEDRCVHRRVSLSLGRRIGDRVRCGYHGLEFDRTGACVRIPGQDVIPPQARVPAYPVVERDGLVWIWLADPAEADSDAVPRYSMCSDPGLAGRTMVLRIDGGARLLIENVLDLSHIAFVHLKTVGSAYVAEHKPSTRVEPDSVEVMRVMKNVENPPLYKQALKFDVGDRVQRIRFWPAGNIDLHITIAPAGSTDPGAVRNLHVLSPVTPERARSHFQFFGMYRDFDIANAALTEYVAEQFRATVVEDKAIIEDQQRNLDADPDGTGEISIAADRGPLAARRILDRLSAREHESLGAA